MSTLKATNLQHASSASPNIVLDSSGNATMAGNMAMNSSFLRNRIINGAMMIDQRNAGASVTPTDGAYTLDRWKFRVSQTSKLTVQQNAGSVTSAVGFPNYLGVTSSSSYSVNSTDYFVFIQEIEGFNFADFNFGTANARTVTLSFWVYSSLTGTFSVTLRNSASNRSYPVTYTISSANTWEQKTITIPGDTTGTWVGATNGIGASVIFNLGCGSTFNGTSGSWQAGNFTSVSGATSVVGTNGATFYLTGVQLEVGSVATPFERRLYPQELSMCQRYYQQSRACANDNGAAANTKVYYVPVNFNVAMRAAPTVSYTAITSTNVTARAAVNIFEYGFAHQVTASGGPTMLEISTAISSVEL